MKKSDETLTFTGLKVGDKIVGFKVLEEGSMEIKLETSYGEALSAEPTIDINVEVSVKTEDKDGD